MIDPPEPLGPRRQDEQRRLVELGRDLRGEQLRVVLDLRREVAEEIVDDVLVAFPLPTMTRRASGTDVTTRRQAAASPSMFLYASSIPTKTRDRPRRGSA